jgi:sulfate/thiosulfate transport system ATP-binding protein
MGIVVEQVSKQFGSFQALDQVSLEIKSGALVALLVPLALENRRCCD